MKRRIVRYVHSVIVLLISMFITMGCSKDASRQPLTISVAASLTDCMEAIEKAYTQAYPASNIRFNFGGSGTLRQQIEQGAPVDVFIPASTKQVTVLEEKGLLEETVPLLQNKLVLIAKENDGTLSFENLGQEAIGTLAVGEFQSVPVGQYTEEVLVNLGLKEKLQQKLVFGKDVREVLFWVEGGHAEAGIVYETDAKISDKVVVCDTADKAWHEPIQYPVAIIKESNRMEEAKQFVDFLQSSQAEQIFLSYGFTPIKEMR